MYPRACCLREVFSVDLAVLELNGAPSKTAREAWEDAFLAGDWKTIALVEHENTEGRLGLIPTVRKLAEFRDDVIRVGIGYSSQGDEDMEPRDWSRALGPVNSMKNLLLVVGSPAERGVEWRFYHFLGGRPTVLHIDT